MKNFFIALLGVIILTSCSSKNKKMEVKPESAKILYDDSMKTLKIGNYYFAAENFEKIEDSYPFTDESINGLIMSAYSYYKAREYDDSIRIINYFIQSNPANPNLDYMQYLKSLNYYDRMKSVHRAREITEQANMNLKILTTRYPYSIYIADAKKKLEKVETYLSGNEMTIAKYYFKRKNYLGSINHYTNVVENYPNSNYTPEALYRLIEINNLLNLKLEILKFYQILANNYSDSNWTKNANKIIKNYES